MDTASASLAASATGDLARLAADQLRRVLHRRHDAAVLTDLLEEDLRAALANLEAIRLHLEDVIGALLADRPAPLDLLEAGDDRHAQDALGELEAVLGSLRRRLSQAAQRVAASPREPGASTRVG
jgi:hypothetical protein